MPLVHCHECQKHRANGNGLTATKCDGMLRDRRGKAWKMWAQGGWGFRAEGAAACFEEGWQHFDFDVALQGGGCDRNWLEGVAPWPKFPRPAPALLGFDETICAPDIRGRRTRATVQQRHT